MNFIATSVTRPTRNVVWFRNDLRLRDNGVLSEVINRAKGVDTVFVYSFDPRSYKKTKYNSFKTGVFRAQFTIESVANLRKNLRAIGCDLLVTCKKPEEVIPFLFCDSTSPGCVYVGEETASEEVNIEKKVEKNCLQKGIQLVKVGGEFGTLYHPDDLPFAQSLRDMPDTMTVFRERIEKVCRIRPLAPVINAGDFVTTLETRNKLARMGVIDEFCGFDFLPTLDMLGLSSAATATTQTTSSDESNRGVYQFTGGEDEALRRMDNWMFRDNHLQEYFEIRNGMLGEAYSSKLSPWMALGCVSARTIYYATKRYEREKNIVNKSTYWMTFELICRDYFRFFCKKYGNKVFMLGGARDVKKRWASANTVSGNNITSSGGADVEELIYRWKTGTTGVPLVDANMRELLHTGWMSNRGRQNVASFLVNDLRVDWRVGADHFESYLLDHDVYSNYGNWNHAAGLHGGRNNVFNMVKQSRDYDPTGAYIRHWLPELANIPAPFIFEPWNLSSTWQERFQVTIGTTYPNNISLAIGGSTVVDSNGGAPSTEKSGNIPVWNSSRNCDGGKTSNASRKLKVFPPPTKTSGNNNKSSV